jgi:hypothetical protein
MLYCGLTESPVCASYLGHAPPFACLRPHDCEDVGPQRDMPHFAYSAQK